MKSKGVKKSKRTRPELAEGYVIGVDGGGTKTIAALADFWGKILKTGKSGSSSPRNVGIKKATDNISKAIKKALRGRRKADITSTFIGLPAIAEEFKPKKSEIRRKLLRKIPQISKGKVIIDSDQKVAFRAGTKQKDGVLIIAGTGCVAHGWRGRKQAHSSGWGWLADEGAAFFAGQKTFQAILKDLDDRGPKTLLARLAFEEFKIKTKEDLASLIYSKNPTEIVPHFSIICDKASQKGDKVARNIMLEAAKEIALTVKPIIQKLRFKNTEFPLVMVGGMFKTKILLNKVKREIRKISPKVKFILLKKAPIIGAVKLAIEQS